MKILKCISIILSLFSFCILIGGLNVALALDHTTIKAYPDRSFSLGWTHNVDTPNGILWYNAQTGAGAVGRLE